MWLSMAPKVGTGVGKPQVVELRLIHPREMFQLPQADLFSEYRNFLTGVDFCLSELRGRLSARPVWLEIALPANEIYDDTASRLAVTLRRYCEDRIRYNRRESLAQRLGGVSALRLGLPIAAIGFALAVAANLIQPANGLPHVIADTLGWVLVWIGLWFPLDQLLFYPLGYGRESRALRLLSYAQIELIPYEPVTVGPLPYGRRDRNSSAGPGVVPESD